MTTELIAELCEMCVKLVRIARNQHDVLEQLGAEIREDEALAVANRLKEITGDWEDD